jgi:CheY-like chemotaxis protein
VAGAGGPVVGTVPVVVVADDLIWAERLAGIVRAIGRRPTVVRSLDALRAAAGDGPPVVVDLTARAYDGLGAVAAARAAGCRVLAVAQHDDLELHRRARAAGAERVVAYRLLHERGVDVIRAWLAGSAVASPPAGSASGR